MKKSEVNKMPRQVIDLDAMTASDSVYTSLRKMIIDRELVSGQKLSEVALTQKLGVSRTPIREALRRLAADGFVNIVPKCGARVARMKREDIEDMYELRAHLEGWAAYRAAGRITPLTAARLEEKIAEEEIIFAERDLERYIEVNRAFHMLIAEASGNKSLAEYIAQIHERTFVCMVLIETSFDFDDPTLEDHREIVRCLKAGDAETAMDLSEKHVMASLLDFGS